MPDLRPYQSEGIKNIFSAWREGHRSVLFQMPTGTGKTYLFADITRRGFEQDRKILLIVHRIELVEQIKKELQSKGVEAGLIVAGQEADYSKIVQIASIQTLSRRKHPQANLIIIDECHHSKADTYKQLWDIYKDAKFLGVTATPIRLNGDGFDDVFDCLITSGQLQHFIDNGYLVPVNQYVCLNPNLSNVKVIRGDYNTGSLSDVMTESSVMADILDSYKNICIGKSTIIFAVDVVHSKAIVRTFLNEGISAAHVDSKTPSLEREKILSDFRSGIIKVVSNVEIITEGFDFPECEAVILARPTKSLALYMQMAGRVMRPAIGKKEGVILDCASQWLEHGICTMDRKWSLYSTKKKRRYLDFTDKLLAIDNEGVVFKPKRHIPDEIKGLKLININNEFDRLLMFESFLKDAIKKNHRILSCYFRYKDSLQLLSISMTELEFNYIQKRLNEINEIVDLEKRFKPNYWIMAASNINT